MKNITFTLLFFIGIFGFSQTKKDTVYIYFDSSNVNMKKFSFKTIKSNVYPDEEIILSHSYFIEEKKTIESQEVDTGYKFVHYNWDKHSLDFWKMKNPLVKYKNISFLDSVKLLDINFFQTTDYYDVCKTFEAEDSWAQDVIIFMIDKDEINNGKIIMREVSFSRPSKE